MLDRWAFRSLLGALLLVSCQDDAADDAQTDTDPTGLTDATTGTSGTSTSGTTTDPTDTQTGSTGAATDVPMIDEVLECGTKASAGGLAPGGELQRHDLDLQRFPDAMCNDGTPGFFYYRGPQTDAGADRWVIQLQGGGGCRDATSCLARWCSVDTNFGMTQMTGTLSPEAIDGKGILARHPDNPIADAHQVFVRYCSSDTWQGQRSDVVLTGPHPVSGDEVSARVHFRGATIFDAVITTLQEEHGLTQASNVVFAGASAGGSGVITHADALRARLSADNPDLRFVVLHDSNFPPAAETLDYEDSRLCTELQLCDWQTHYVYEESEGSRPFRESRLDESCLQWHAEAGDTWACVDLDHVLLNHVTAPMMVRMGQTDTLLMGNTIEQGFGSQGTPLDPPLFAQLVRDQAERFAQARTTAEEGEALQADPALFVPTCSKHETLSSNNDVYNVAIDDDGTPVRMFEVFTAWLTDTTPWVVIATEPSDNVCP